MPGPDEEHIQRAVDRVTQMVAGSASGRMPGAAIGVVVRREFPGLLEQIKLSTLLDQHAPRLTVVGRAGEDVLWGLDRADDAPPVDLDAVLEIGESPIPVTGRPEDVSLERVRLVNYRSIRDVELVLEPLTVLVGPNGAGKSNILDGIFRGVQLTHQKPETVFDGSHAFHRVVRRGDGAEGFTIALEGGDNWSMKFSSSPEPGFVARAGGRGGNLRSLLLTPLSRAFGPAARLQLSANMLARETWSDEEEPYLRSDGLYLPSVLDYLAGSDRPRLDAITDRVRGVVKQVRDLRTPRRKIRQFETEVLRIDGQEVRRRVEREVMGNALEVDIEGSGWTPADQLSEGTLLLIGLHTVLSRPRPPKVILIDDLDRALHPNAQRTLVEQLMGIVSPRQKIVASSHSPFVLDPLEPKAVRVVQLGQSGGTTIGRLTDHPEWDKWQGGMTPAEFWQYAGDDWLAERA